jgi:hypothetical protein
LKQNNEKRVVCFEAKRLKGNSEKIIGETVRNEGKNYFGFAKKSENEAKQDAFRFSSLRS